MKQKTNSVLIAISAMALFASCGNTGEEQKTATPMRVQSEVVRLSTDVNRNSYVGIVEEESAISVGFTGSGTISKIYVSEGQAVKKGQLLAELDKTQAQNMLATAQAQMMQANDAFNRLKQLHDNNSLPEMEWVEVQSKVQQAEAALEIAKKNLADCSIYAPESGIVGKGVMNVGEVVLPADISKHVQKIHFILQASKTTQKNLSVAGYNGKLYMTFSRRHVENGAERIFLKTLEENGVNIIVSSNYKEVGL